MRKNAFTLAEVLITLGVIGVISAITLPTVIHKIQMSVLQSQFKKAFSIMSNAMEKARVDSEYSLKCSSSASRDCPEWNNLFESQFKIIKICESNSYENGCIGNINGIDKVVIDKNSAQYSDNHLLFYNDRIKSGYAFVIAGGISVQYYAKLLRGVYLLDINGTKGPNKWGYDVFSLSIDGANTKLVCTEKLKNFYEVGGKSCEDMITNK